MATASPQTRQIPLTFVISVSQMSAQMDGLNAKVIYIINFIS